MRIFLAGATGAIGRRLTPSDERALPRAGPQARLVSVFTLDIVDGAVQTVRSVINPEKLGHLGPLADVRALLRQGRR